jgi:hypothetical protein
MTVPVGFPVGTLPRYQLCVPSSPETDTGDVGITTGARAVAFCASSSRGVAAVRQKTAEAAHTRKISCRIESIDLEASVVSPATSSRTVSAATQNKEAHTPLQCHLVSVVSEMIEARTDR